MKDMELKYWTTQPNLFLVAETESGRIVGCISYRQITPNTVEMHRLSVHSNYRKLGIGRKLLQTLINTAKENGYDTMYLETWPRPAEILYEKMEFKFFREKTYLSSAIDYLTGMKLLCYIYRMQ